ncbi:MAG: AfsR/SARP family transcriptional regulator [Acidimicrobiales bacterium]
MRPSTWRSATGRLTALTAAAGWLLIMAKLLGDPGQALAVLVGMSAHPPTRLDDTQIREVTSLACWAAWAGYLVVTAQSWRRAAALRLATPTPVSAKLLPVAAEGGRSARLVRQPASRPDTPPRKRQAEMPRTHDHETKSDRLAPDASGATLVACPQPQHLETPEWSRALVGLASAAGLTSRLPLVWRIGAESVATFCPRRSSPPPPFSAGPEAGWQVPRDSRLVTNLDPLAVLRASMRAGLVTFATSDGARCLLDVVAAGTVALDGPPVAVGYTLSDVVVELASRRWSDLEEVWLVGFGREMHGLENVRYLAGVAEAAALLANRERSGEARSRCFVVAPASEGPERAAMRGFLRLAEQIPMTGVVCCDTAAGAQCNWHLESHRSTLRLEVMARNGVSAVVTPDRWVELTGKPPMPLTSGVPAPQVPPEAVAPATVPDAVTGCLSEHDDGEHGIEVRVLGPLKIDGLPASIDRSWRLSELIVYMAFHPDGVTGESCLEALWPDKRLPLQSLSNRLSEARRTLGTADDGRHRLQKTEGRYALGDDVRTDWERFRRLTGDDSDPSCWMRAMGLVRGRPFDGLAQGDWTILEGFASDITAAILDLAIRLAEHHLASADPQAAEWALRRALIVSPFDERLYRLLMRACDALGNRAGVAGALRTLATALDWAGDPLAIVHPETATLYNRLVGRRV